LREKCCGPRTWLIASTRYVQTLNFYTEHFPLPDEALLEVRRDAGRLHWDEPLPPEEVASDLQLADMLLGDQRRARWRRETSYRCRRCAASPH